MNEQSEQIKKNFLEQWIRLAFVALYIIAFALLWPLIAAALLVLIILQSLHRVIASTNNKTLLNICDGLGNFLFKILQYVLYLNDEKPIDFEAFFSKTAEDNERAKQADDESEVTVASAVMSESAKKDAGKSTPKPDQNEADDVFADISFTEKTDDDADDNDEDQQKN